MTEFDDARALAHAAGALAVRTESLTLADAIGRTLRMPVLATAPLPGFDPAAMDGWAVNGDGPWMLGSPINAGDDIPPEPLSPGAARPISTGAPVPPGTSRVMRSERGEARASELHELEPDANEHIRRAGEEATVGDELLAAGMRLTPPRIALAAAAGLDVLSVAATPTVRLLVLGDEVVDAGAPIPGRVRDVFTPSLPAVLVALGTALPSLGRVGDSLDATVAALDGGDLVVTTGGTARGRADHVRDALSALGAELIIDGVRMRPGHPLLLARLPSGTIVLSLPGNPLAAYVGLVAIGGALVGGMVGRAHASLRTARLGGEVDRGSVTRVVPCTVGQTGAVPVAHIGAGMLRGIAAANVLAVIPPEGASLGDEVAVIALPWSGLGALGLGF